jgi:ribulose-phosphate 3-epimerase
MRLRSLDWIAPLPTHRLIGEFSLWSADPLRLADELVRISPFADVLHIDAADGGFSPALLLFPDLVAAVRKATSLPIHVHLMVRDDILLSQVDQFASAGADAISVHAENANAEEALARIAEHGAAPGLVLQVGTPIESALPFLPRLRLLTLLGTAIGVKGQDLDPSAAARLKTARAAIEARRKASRILLAADGGVREATVPALRAAGADSVVLGSLAFGAPDLAARVAWLHGL